MRRLYLNASWYLLRKRDAIASILEYESNKDLSIKKFNGPRTTLPFITDNDIKKTADMAVLHAEIII